MLGETDANGAAAALLRLQRVYNLSTEDLAEGWVRDKHAQPLEGPDFYNLGNLATSQGDYGIAAQWLSKAISQEVQPTKEYHLKDAVHALARVHSYVSFSYLLKLWLRYH